jgi:hypothetical protein
MTCSMLHLTPTIIKILFTTKLNEYSSSYQKKGFNARTFVSLLFAIFPVKHAFAC